VDRATLARVARRLRARADAINGAAFLMPWANNGYPGIDCSPGAATLGARVAALGQAGRTIAAAACAPIEPANAKERVAEAFAAAEPARLFELRAEGATAFLRDAFDALDDAGARVARAVAILGPAIDATPAGGQLFAALQAQPRPADPLTHLFRACEMTRERRGASHVAAAAELGLGTCELCVLTGAVNGEDWLSVVTTWPGRSRDEAREGLAARGLLTVTGEATDAGRELRAGVEIATDDRERPLAEALGGDADELIELLGPLARAVLAHAGAAGT